jgi:hypothetical protein
LQIRTYCRSNPSSNQQSTCGYAAGQPSPLSAEALATAQEAAKLPIALAGGGVTWPEAPGFVDDKCLLSTSFTEMQDMLDVAAAVSRTQRSVYSLPKPVLIQFVGSHRSRREGIALALKGMHGEPVTVGEQVATPQADVDVRGKVVNPREHAREVHWWKYVGVALQADMKHDKMVDQIVGAGKAKAVALGNYLSFAGGLTAVVQLLPWSLPSCRASCFMLLRYGAGFVWKRVQRSGIWIGCPVCGMVCFVQSLGVRNMA